MRIRRERRLFLVTISAILLCRRTLAVCWGRSSFLTAPKFRILGFLVFSLVFSLVLNGRRSRSGASAPDPLTRSLLGGDTDMIPACHSLRRRHTGDLSVESCRRAQSGRSYPCRMRHCGRNAELLQSWEPAWSRRRLGHCLEPRGIPCDPRSRLSSLRRGSSSLLPPTPNRKASAYRSDPRNTPPDSWPGAAPRAPCHPLGVFGCALGVSILGQRETPHRAGRPTEYLRGPWLASADHPAD